MQGALPPARSWRHGTRSRRHRASSRHHGASSRRHAVSSRRGQLPAPRGQLPAPRGQIPVPRGQLPAPRGQLPVRPDPGVQPPSGRKESQGVLPCDPGLRLSPLGPALPPLYAGTVPTFQGRGEESTSLVSKGTSDARHPPSRSVTEAGFSKSENVAEANNDTKM